eukprot:5912988-Pyramimonas_sp.AAC.1
MQMPASSRGLPWSGDFSEVVWASRRALPGCSMAMYILQLVMLTPLEALISSPVDVDRALH